MWSSYECPLVQTISNTKRCCGLVRDYAALHSYTNLRQPFAITDVRFTIVYLPRLCFSTTAYIQYCTIEPLRRYRRGLLASIEGCRHVAKLALGHRRTPIGSRPIRRHRAYTVVRRQPQSRKSAQPHQSSSVSGRRWHLSSMKLSDYGRSHALSPSATQRQVHDKPMAAIMVIVYLTSSNT